MAQKFRAGNLTPKFTTIDGDILRRYCTAWEMVFSKQKTAAEAISEVGVFKYEPLKMEEMNNFKVAYHKSGLLTSCKYASEEISLAEPLFPGEKSLRVVKFYMMEGKTWQTREKEVGLIRSEMYWLKIWGLFNGAESEYCPEETLEMRGIQAREAAARMQTFDGDEMALRSNDTIEECGDKPGGAIVGIVDDPAGGMVGRNLLDISIDQIYSQIILSGNASSFRQIWASALGSEFFDI